jgi:peptide/nickel transport system ATP-binding protein
VTTLLDVERLHIHFKSSAGEVRAVDDVSLQLPAGGVLGIVGESGSGKSVLVRSVLGLTPKNSVAMMSGHIRFQGTDILALSEKDLNRNYRGKRIAMVFQDPMTALNPVKRIGDQLIEPMMAHLGLDRKSARLEAIDLLDQVGIPKPAERVDDYPHQLSGGMRQRVVIAIALSCKPDLLLADEPTTALDVTVQAQILDLLQLLRVERQMSMILVSHDLGLVASHADHVAVMYGGRLAEVARSETLFVNPRMPYTKGLLDSIPDVAMPSHTRLSAIPGSPPILTVQEPGCRFAPRCGYASQHCLEQRPPMEVALDDASHSWACWNPLSSAGVSA